MHRALPRVLIISILLFATSLAYSTWLHVGLTPTLLVSFMLIVVYISHNSCTDI